MKMPSTEIPFRVARVVRAMSTVSNFLAVDLGASSGRVVVGHWDGSKFSLEELHRFSNGGVSLLGHMHWDVLRLWSEICDALAKYCAHHAELPAGISVDSWGVDFGLLDSDGSLIGNPFHYRDSRTDGIAELVMQQCFRTRDLSADCHSNAALQHDFSTLQHGPVQERATRLG